MIQDLPKIPLRLIRIMWYNSHLYQYWTISIHCWCEL